VVSGQFLIDSEASMQGVLERQAAPASAAAAAVHEAVGRIVAFDGQTITLDHEAVPALQWPAMEMDFTLARPGLVQGLKPGDTVRFSFREAQQGHEVVALRREAKGSTR
jgi:Cu(I)/Ag(I) efflux system membrane fusion protein